MSIWYVHRRDDGSIASFHQEVQPGYAEEPVEYEPVAEQKQAAIHAVTVAAEAVRNRVAPYSNYMDTEYQVLAAQADAYVLAGSPENPVGLAMLVQSAQDSGRTIAQEAALVQARRDAYIALLNATRSLRRQGIAAIEAATDVASIHSARDQYVDQLASL